MLSGACHAITGPCHASHLVKPLLEVRGRPLSLGDACGGLLGLLLGLTLRLRRTALHPSSAHGSRAGGWARCFVQCEDAPLILSTSALTRSYVLGLRAEAMNRVAWLKQRLGAVIGASIAHLLYHQRLIKAPAPMPKMKPLLYAAVNMAMFYRCVRLQGSEFPPCSGVGLENIHTFFWLLLVLLHS